MRKGGSRTAGQRRQRTSGLARHRGELLDTPVYEGAYARAAALVHTLGRGRWLERCNLTVACAVAVMYLEASNISVSPTREQLTALAHELNNPRCTAARIASFLRTWKPWRWTIRSGWSGAAVPPTTSAAPDTWASNGMPWRGRLCFRCERRRRRETASSRRVRVGAVLL